MKHLKKIMALAIALVMCMSVMGVTAFAADHTITINRDSSFDNSTSDGTTGTGTSNEKYTYWLILKADIGSLKDVDQSTGELKTTPADNGKVSYYVTDSTIATALTNLKVSDEDGAAALFDVTKSTDGTRWNVKLHDDSTSASTIAERLVTLTGSGKAYGTGTEVNNGGEKTTITGAEDGYYLITSTLGDKIVVQTLGDVTINEKNKYPSVDKTQNDASATGTYKDDAVDVGIGDTVYYQALVYVPATVNGEITLTDTMSAGLTPGAANTVTATVSDTKDGTYETLANTGEANYSVTLSEQVYTIKIKNTDATKGKYIKFQYTGVVNQSALADTTEENKIKLEYSNYSQEDKVEFNTYATGAVKYDGATATQSEGVLTKKADASAIKYLSAKFKLQQSTDNGTTWTDVVVAQDSTDKYYYPATGTTVDIVSDSTTGEIIIRGLDKDKKYQLVETEAPTGGYNLMTTPAALTLTEEANAKTSVTISGDESATVTKLTAANVVKIENNQGTQLPSTGGIGTTIFYVIGAVLVIGAGVLLVTRRRMRAE